MYCVIFLQLQSNQSHDIYSSADWLSSLCRQNRAKIPSRNFRYFRPLSIDMLNIRVFSLSKRWDNWVIRLRRSALPLISWIIQSNSERWKLASWQPSILIIVKRVHSDGGAEDGWIGWSVCGLNGHVLPAALDIKDWWTALSLSKHSRMNTAAGRDTGPLC